VARAVDLERKSPGADIGPLPDTWRVAKIGELAEVKYGKANPKSKGPVPVVGSGGVFAWTDQASVDGPTIVVGRKGTAGAAQYFEGPCYPSDTTFYLVWKAKDADPLYVFYCLAGMPLSGEHARTTLPSLQRPYLEAHPIPLPPLSEQRAIASVLTAVRQAIETTEAVIEAMEVLKKSLMRHLFTFGPVANDSADDTALKETDVGLIPRDWETLAVSEVVALMQYGANTRAEPEGTYPILRMNNLTNGRIDISNLKYVDLDARSAQRFKLEPGDLLFNRTNSQDLVGKTSLFDLPEHFVFASYLIRVKCNANRANPRFLNAYLNWDKTQSRLRMLATRGVGQSNISASKLRGLLICLPPADVQSDIADCLRTVDRKIDRERYRRECLGFLFKSLLRDLMTGRIRVDGESA